MICYSLQVSPNDAEAPARAASPRSGSPLYKTKQTAHDRDRGRYAVSREAAVRRPRRPSTGAASAALTGIEPGPAWRCYGTPSLRSDCISRPLAGTNYCAIGNCSSRSTLSRPAHPGPTASPSSLRINAGTASRSLQQSESSESRHCHSTFVGTTSHRRRTAQQRTRSSSTVPWRFIAGTSETRGGQLRARAGHGRHRHCRR